MVIFGVKTRSKSHGPAYPTICSQCGNETHYFFVKWRRWYHILFIPVFPWGANYQLDCPHCDRTLALDETQANVLKRLAAANEKYREGELSE
jgi:hypothetical protein